MTELPEDFGNLGVRIFFVISGFLITTLLLRERQTTGRISLRNFYIRRFFRIMPAAYLFIGIVAILNAGHWITLLHHDLLCAVTYTMNNHPNRAWWLGHLWSLSVEEQFYILWPPLVAWWGSRQANRIAVGLIAIAPFVRVLLLRGFPAWRDGIGNYFPTIGDAIAIGCVLAYLQPWLSEQKSYIRFLRSPWFYLVPASVFLLNYSFSTTVSMGLEESLLDLAIAITVDGFTRFPETGVGQWLNSAPMRWIGVMSYSLYLWQQLFLNRFSGAVLNTAPLNLVLAFAVATASYYIVEMPFLKLKARFSWMHDSRSAT